jgi:hypothetical protein
VEHRVHLEGPVEVVLAIEDGNAYVAAQTQEVFQVVRCPDFDRLVASLNELGADGSVLSWRESDCYC